MTLKFKRNLPLIIFLVGIVSILIFAIGGYPIVACGL